MASRSLSTPETLAREPEGNAAWVQIAGGSMSPLLESGDLLLVRRCDAKGVRRGDVVVVRSARGTFVSHLVVETDPSVRTASFSGKLDADGNELLGRADAVHTRGVDVPLPESSRALVWALYRLNAHSGGSSVVAAARSVFRAAAQTRLGNELRRWRLAPLEFRLLNATDTSALVVFAQRHLEVPVPFLKRQLRLRWHQAGAAAGAFDVRGRLCGFAYFDDFRQEGLQLDGWWIRSLFVAPRARRLGVASQLVGLLCARAKEQGVTCLRADVPASNRASLNMFERASFVPSEPSVVERVTREWERNGVYDQWAVLENPL